MTTPARVQRLCDVCGALDADPRHVTSVPPNYEGAVPSDEFINGLPDGTPARAIAELLDASTIVRHMDCCASRGCSICRATEAVHGGVRGEELIASIASGAADHLSDSQAVEA